MAIRDANKEDWEEFVKFKKEEDKCYSIVIGKKIVSPKMSKIKKEFLKNLKDKNHKILFFIQEGKLEGYIHGTFFENLYSKGGFVEDLFVLPKFRGMGIATRLYENFEEICKEKGLKKIHLSVNVKNTNAYALYEKLGFEIYHYDMKKEI